MREFVCGYQTLLTCGGEIVGFIVVVLVLGLVGLIQAAEWWKTYRCRHAGRISENRSCDAICDDCGKNLGFIGAWRDKQKSGNEI